MPAWHDSLVQSTSHQPGPHFSRSPLQAFWLVQATTQLSDSSQVGPFLHDSSPLQR